MNTTRLVLVLGPLLVGSARGAPQEDPEFPRASLVEIVNVKGERLTESWIQLVVSDDKGDPVRDLELAELEITLGGKECADARGVAELTEQEIGEVPSERLQAVAASECDVVRFSNPSQERGRPRAIAVVIDISGSVAQRDPDGALPEERLGNLAESLRAGLSVIFRPEDIYLFARFSDVYYVSAPTRDPGALNQVLMRPYRKEWGAGTPYYSVVRILGDRLKAFRELPKAIVMFSDCAPHDRVDQSLDLVRREIDETSSARNRWELSLLRSRLLTKAMELREGALDFTLEAGIPVYNVHFPDESRSLQARAKAECHNWVRRTGGGVYWLSAGEDALRNILQDVDNDTDNAYILAIRHEGLEKRKLTIRIAGHPRWTTVYPGEFLTLGSIRDILVHNIYKGDPEERLEAAFVARGYRTPAIREALRKQLGAEHFDAVRETMVDSLLTGSLSEVCSPHGERKDGALEDLAFLQSSLPNVEHWQRVAEAAGGCLGDAKVREALLLMWEREQDTEVKRLLYDLMLRGIRSDLEGNFISTALKYAERLGGSGVRDLLRSYVDENDLDPEIETRIEKSLQKKGPG